MSSATELFAIVPVRSPGRTPDDAIVIGDLKEVMQYIPQSVARDDAIAELDRARFTADQISSLQQKTRGVQVTMINDSISHLSRRLDKILARRDAQARARKRRDEEAEAQRIQAELGALPDPDAPVVADPALPLMSKYPDPADEPQADAALPGDPSTPATGFGTDQSEFPDPDLPHTPVVQQPIAAGLDAD
jgi:hypothetical protein